MTDRTELERQIAELQAQLAALDAEPYPALRALIRFHETCGHEGGGSDAAIARAKDELAALPLAPRAVMDDAAVEALKHLKRWLGEWCELDLSEVIADNGGTAGQYVQHEAKSKIAMIRTTLANLRAAIARAGGAE